MKTLTTAQKQLNYLNKLLVLNPKMTVGQAAHRLRVLNMYIDKYKVMEA